MDVEMAPDVQEKVEDIVQTLQAGYINQYRLICMRSRGNKARAYARIWNLPDIWQKALDVKTFYIIEVLHEHFDPLNEEEKEKTLIHELLHIPKTFSGALLSHGHPTAPVNSRTSNALWKEYRKRKKEGAAHFEFEE
jgi:predicted metallopeptidase